MPWFIKALIFTERPSFLAEIITVTSQDAEKSMAARHLFKRHFSPLKIEIRRCVCEHLQYHAGLPLSETNDFLPMLSLSKGLCRVRTIFIPTSALILPKGLACRNILPRQQLR